MTDKTLDADEIELVVSGENIDDVERMEVENSHLELSTDPELRRIEHEFTTSSERLRHLNAIIDHVEGLEHLYGDDKMIERQVVQEIRMKAEQLRGDVSDI